MSAGVHGAGRAASPARGRPPEAADRGGRVDGPSSRGGRAAGARRGRERAVPQRRDSAARGRAGEPRRHGGPAAGRGSVHRRARRRRRPPAAGRVRVHVGPSGDGHRAPGPLGPHGQGGSPARRGRGRVPAGVRRVAQHDHRGVRVAAARGRPAQAVPHDGRATLVGQVPDGRTAQRRHAARLRGGHGRRARRQDDPVAGPAAAVPAHQARVAGRGRPAAAVVQEAHGATRQPVQAHVHLRRRRRRRQMFFIPITRPPRQRCTQPDGVAIYCNFCLFFFFISLCFYYYHYMLLLFTYLAVTQDKPTFRDSFFFFYSRFYMVFLTYRIDKLVILLCSRTTAMEFNYPPPIPPPHLNYKKFFILYIPLWEKFYPYDMHLFSPTIFSSFHLTICIIICCTLRTLILMMCSNRRTPTV